MGRRCIWNRCGAEREHTGEETRCSKMWEGEKSPSWPTLASVTYRRWRLGDMYVSRSRIALAERRSMDSLSQDRKNWREQKQKHTQVMSFGVCAAREKPLLKHILIRAVRKRANGDFSYECHQY